MASSAWKIKVGVELDTGDIQSQLNKGAKGKGLKLDLGKPQDVRNMGLEYQQYMLILQKSVGIIKDMAEQTIALDSAQTEFRKVSELSGESLDRYTEKLAKMGKQVGRSG